MGRGEGGGGGGVQVSLVSGYAQVCVKMRPLDSSQVVLQLRQLEGS